MYKDFWLHQSNQLVWRNKPKVPLVIKKDNTPLWFPDGKLNICDNFFLNKKKNQIAIYFFDKYKKLQKFSYLNLERIVKNFIFQFNTKMKNKNINRVMIHGSASIETAVAMIAFGSLGIHFSVLFEDLPERAILKRIAIFKPNVFITRLEKNVFFNKNNFINKKKFNKSKLFFFNEFKISKKKPKKIKLRSFKSTRNFFTLFTSGSTGMPKGVIHGTGGYLLYSKYTCIKKFGLNNKSIILTGSDAGWINGHTYALFGPLSIGCSTVIIERPIDLLDLNFLKKVLKIGVTVLYLPVTLIRLMKSTFPKKKLGTKKLKTLGSMGEPLAPNVGRWYANKFTNNNQAIVNTYFQTETGGIISSPSFSDTINKSPHGSVGELTTSKIRIIKLSNKEKKEFKIINSWPGCMINIQNGSKEWRKYWDNKNNFRLFDYATKTKNHINIHGRVDDVINIRGHRIGSEEIESVVLNLNTIAECAAVSLPDKLEGNLISLFVVKKNTSSVSIDDKINLAIKKNFGVFALPKNIYYLDHLPKTKSGKILRRLLRDILFKKGSGDLSTLNDKKLIYNIRKAIIKKNGKKNN